MLLVWFVQVLVLRVMVRIMRFAGLVVLVLVGKRIRLNRKPPAHLVGRSMHSRPRVWKRLHCSGYPGVSGVDCKERRCNQHDEGVSLCSSQNWSRLISGERRPTSPGLHGKELAVSFAHALMWSVHTHSTVSQQPTNQRTNEPTSEPTTNQRTNNKPANQQQPTTTNNNQQTNQQQPTNQPINQPINQPTKPNQQQTNQPTNQPPPPTTTTNHHQPPPPPGAILSKVATCPGASLAFSGPSGCTRRCRRRRRRQRRLRSHLRHERMAGRNGPCRVHAP